MSSRPDPTPLQQDEPLLRQSEDNNDLDWRIMVFGDGRGVQCKLVVHV